MYSNFLHGALLRLTNANRLNLATRHLSETKHHGIIMKTGHLKDIRNGKALVGFCFLGGCRGERKFTFEF